MLLKVSVFRGSIAHLSGDTLGALVCSLDLRLSQINRLALLDARETFVAEHAGEARAREARPKVLAEKPLT